MVGVVDVETPSVVEGVLGNIDDLNVQSFNRKSHGYIAVLVCALVSFVVVGLTMSAIVATMVVSMLVATTVGGASAGVVVAAGTAVATCCELVIVGTGSLVTTVTPTGPSVPVVSEIAVVPTA